MRVVEGIRVLDFRQIYAGHFTRFELAVTSADVIKVEPCHSPDLDGFDGLFSLVTSKKIEIAP